MKVLSNEELTEKLLRLEQAFLGSRQREINNTYRSEDAKGNIELTVPIVLEQGETLEKVDSRTEPFTKTITKQMFAGVKMPMLNARLRAGTYMVTTDADHYIVNGTCKILGQGENFAITRDAYISIVAICNTDKVAKLTINKI